MTRHAIPRAQSCVASECRCGWMAASWARPRWRTTRVQVCGGWWLGAASAGLERGTTRAGGVRAASRPATAPGSVWPGALSGLVPRGPVAPGPAAGRGPCPRPAAGAPPAGAIHRPRSVADPAQLGGGRPRPTANGRPGDSPPRTVLGGAEAACASGPAMVAAGCSPQKPGAPRGGYGRAAPRVSSTCYYTPTRTAEGAHVGLPFGLAELVARTSGYASRPCSLDLSQTASLGDV